MFKVNTILSSIFYCLTMKAGTV